MENTFQVAGMTCGHCVAAVTEEITKIPGVRAVSIDLPTGAVRVESDVALPRQRVADAVVEAGYELVP